MEETYEKCGGAHIHQEGGRSTLAGYYAAATLLVLLCPAFLHAGAGLVFLPQVFSKVFSGESGYQQGDLICRADFDRVLELLEPTGVPTQRFAPLREQIPGDQEYLQQLNATKQGKKFLRSVADTPGGYASVEELASRPGGEKTLNQLSKDKGGERMIQYIAGTPGGREMMRQVPGGQRRKGPAEPRIYTASQLLGAMQKLAAAP